jgi:hypothetical protein
MPYLPQRSFQRRAERASFAESTPVVLRFDDGQRASGTLKVISLTGGLLTVSRPVTQGLTAKVMFLTRAGSVLGIAEMLSPLTWDQQPFKFVSLHHDDESRLQAAIQACQQASRTQDKKVLRDRELVENVRAW